MDIGELSQEGYDARDAASTCPSSESSVLWSLQSELARRSAAGDWDALDAISGAIFALSKGKGKGKGGKGGFKGGGKGSAGGKGEFQGNFGKGSYAGGKGGYDYGNDKGGGKGAFEGNCNHCGAYGHRKSQCRKLDQELAARGGKGGGKKGGKGLYHTYLEDGWNSEGAANGAAEQAGAEPEKGQEEHEESEWWVGAAFSLGRESPAGFQAPRKPPAPLHPRSVMHRRKPVETANSFAPLARMEEDADCGSVESSADASPWTAQHACGGFSKCRSSRCTACDFEEELKRHERALQLLTRDEKFVGAVSKEAEPQGKYRVIEAVIDSGAEESVAPPGLFPGAVQPSRMSKAGGKYRAANGARIPNLGQQSVRFCNDAGDRCGIVFQVAEVERPLVSATQLAASGNSVVIDRNGAKIVNDKTGKIMRLERRGGVYVLRMRVKADSAPGFPGQGK